MDSFRIESEKLDLKIAIIDIASIHMHEETIPEVVQKLATDLLKDRVLRHPIIVDEKTLVVLDGMHRAAALRIIGCVTIPVCLVDYDNPSITVETWWRAFKEDRGELIKELSGPNIQTERTALEEAKTKLENRTASAFIATKEECLIIKSKRYDLKQNYRLVRDIEQKAKSLGYGMSYETESDALLKLEEGSVRTILAPPPIRKEDVREFGVRDDLFPHKATRHIIPARPLGINVPIEILQNQHMKLPQVNRQLIENLKTRQLQKLQPGAMIENRRYEEQVFLFK